MTITISRKLALNDSIKQSNGFNATYSRAPSSFGKLFSGGTVEPMRVRCVVEWFRSKGEGRLRLPPIQRSFVWRNEQIVNYWDSLMRGYPAGMMMVTRGGRYGRGLEGITEELVATDFQLFDGQQRLTAILLGLGVGSLADSLCLWIDIGSIGSSDDRLYEIRVNSSGQPFGYKSAAPNEKVNAGDRHNVHERWPKDKDGNLQPPDIIFNKISSQRIGELSSSKCTIPLRFILTCLLTIQKEKTKDELVKIAETKQISIGIDIDSLLTRLQSALDAEIIVKLVDDTVLDESNYPRFFRRLGQGGTRLSDDELVYSLIKDSYPHVHDRLKDIVSGVSKFASEVDLVLGALRVAQTMTSSPKDKEFEKAGRPTPDRVRALNKNTATEQYFESMLPKTLEAPRRLSIVIERLRDGLRYNATINARGLPSMLLARLPRELLDVLILFAFKRGETLHWIEEDRSTLIAFVLYWLHFVPSDEKAAYQVFLEVEAREWRFGARSVAGLLCHFETNGIARYAPRAADWADLFKEAEEHGCILARWEERFSSRDAKGSASPGNALRVISTHPELKRRVLIWIQRRYITQAFPNYDPTSTRDDDLPFDLDHAIPHELFGFWWGSKQKPTGLSDTEEVRFKDLRGVVGDSLGNLRWLAAGDNRGRGMRQIGHGDEPPLDDHIEKDCWNSLINANGKFKIWTKDDVASFQRLIDCRTLLLVEMLMEESGIRHLIDIADCPETPPTADQPDDLVAGQYSGLPPALDGLGRAAEDLGGILDPEQ